MVDDGSEDGTLALLQEVEHRYVEVRAVALGRNRGKGRAMAEGVRHAVGDLVLLTDADLSTPIEELRKLEQAITAGADIAFGSRAVAGACELDQPRHRRVMGRAFNRLVQLLFLSAIHDTQCGFKLFRGTVARQLFAVLQTDGFAFDVEILWRARLAGYRMQEVPVQWINSGARRVKPLRHSFEMSRDVIRLRFVGLDWQEHR